METTHEKHPPYLLVGLGLILLTILEVGVVYVPQIPTFPALLVTAGGKAFLIASYFMHLKFDRRLYLLLFAIGAVEMILMIWVLVSLVFSHP